MVQIMKNEEDFKAKIKEAGDKLVVVDFFADWCKVCKAVASELEDMAKEMADVVFLKVNIEECESIVETYSVIMLPTIIFLKNGEKLEALQGSKNVQRLKECTNKYK